MVRHSTHFWPNSINSTPFHALPLRSISISSFCRRLRLPRDLLRQYFTLRFCAHFPFPLHVLWFNLIFRMYSLSGYRPLLFRNMVTIYCHVLPRRLCSAFPVHSTKEEELTVSWEGSSRQADSRWPHGLQPFACWDCGFESRQRHRHMSVVIVMCCQVEVTSSGWSLV